MKRLPSTSIRIPSGSMPLRPLPPFLHHTLLLYLTRGYLPRPLPLPEGRIRRKQRASRGSGIRSDGSERRKGGKGGGLVVTGVVGVLAVVVVVEAMQGEASGKMQSYVQPRLLLWAHWTSPCKLGPPGRTSIVREFYYQLLASGCPPNVAWLSFLEGHCTFRRFHLVLCHVAANYRVGVLRALWLSPGCGIPVVAHSVSWHLSVACGHLVSSPCVVFSSSSSIDHHQPGTSASRDRVE